LAAAAGVGGQRVERAGGVVLGVGAGEHGLVGADEVGAFVVEVLVGDDVEVEAPGGEPGEQVGVGGVVAQAGTERVVEGEVARPHGQDRAAARGEGDAAAVLVLVVGGAAIERPVVGVVGI